MGKEKIVKCKYLQDIGMDVYKMPVNFCKEYKDERRNSWKEQREKYGFDERETWSLDYSICIYIYTRLKMYDEVNIIATDKTIIACKTYADEYGNEEMSMQTLIDFMLRDLELVLSDFDDQKNQELFKHVLKALSETILLFWW